MTLTAWHMKIKLKLFSLNNQMGAVKNLTILGSLDLIHFLRKLAMDYSTVWAS